MTAGTSGRPRAGITLVEILVCVGLFLILANMAFFLVRWGVRASLRGILQTEVTLEAGRILRQVDNDLKNACLEMTGKKFTPDFTDILVRRGDFPSCEYEFLSFPLPGKVKDAVPCGDSGTAFTRANRIRYSISGRKPDSPLFCITRTEFFNPANPGISSEPSRSRVLSDRVVGFQIVPYEIQGEGKTVQGFWINLQLLDSSKGRASLEVPTAGSDVRRPVDAAIADYFWVVIPGFFEKLVNRDGFNPNWHTGISAP